MADWWKPTQSAVPPEEACSLERQRQVGTILVAD
jgi:hypothetical protein